MKVKVFALLCTALMYCFLRRPARKTHSRSNLRVLREHHATLEQGIQAANASAGVDDIRVLRELHTTSVWCSDYGRVQNNGHQARRSMSIFPAPSDI